MQASPTLLAQNLYHPSSRKAEILLPVAHPTIFPSTPPTTSRPLPEPYLRESTLSFLSCVPVTVHRLAGPLILGFFSFGCRLLSLLFLFVLPSPKPSFRSPFYCPQIPLPRSLSTCFFVAPTSFLGCAATNHAPNCTTQLSLLHWSASCSPALSCFLLLLIYPIRAVRWTFSQG